MTGCVNHLQREDVELNASPGELVYGVLRQEMNSCKREMMEAIQERLEAIQQGFRVNAYTNQVHTQLQLNSFAVTRGDWLIHGCLGGSNTYDMQIKASVLYMCLYKVIER